MKPLVAAATPLAAAAPGVPQGTAAPAVQPQHVQEPAVQYKAVEPQVPQSHGPAHTIPPPPPPPPARAPPEPEHPPDAPGAPQTRQAPSPDAARVSAWGRCVAQYSPEPVLSSTLSAIEPVRARGDSFVLSVSSSIQLDILSKEINGLEQRLRQAVGNDDISLEVRLVEGDLPSSLWTDDQVPSAVLEKHPGLADFMAKYKMRLM